MKSGRPQGWHLRKEFVDSDGNVYHRGTIKPKLKGTLPPTEIVKLSKPEKEKKKLEKIQQKARSYKRKLKKKA